MKVSLIIPTKNEANSIEKTLAEVPGGIIDEIIIVDGNSTDGTPEIVKKLGCKVIEGVGGGYGTAVRTGIKQSMGDVLIFMDADGSQNPKDIPRLLEKIKEGYDVGWGSRFLPDGGSADNTLIRSFGNWFFSLLTRLVQGLKVADILYTFSAFKREIFDKIKLESSGFELCIELPLRAHKAGFKFGEIACFERKRFADKTKVNDLFDGWKILLAILKKY